jgi:hypothetical protein
MKQYLLALVCLSHSLWLAAQPHNEFSIYAGGGFSSLQFGSSLPSASFDLGGCVGADYTIWVVPQWGVGIGAEVALLQTKASLSDFSGADRANDGVDDFYFLYRVNKYTEKGQIYSLNIPVMFYYQRPVSDVAKWVVGLGGKMSIPLQSRFSGTSDSVTTSGYYPAYDLLLQMPKFRGFGTFSDVKTITSPGLKIAYLISLETGIKWSLSSKGSLYAGVYVDYGLTQMVNDPQNQPFLPYNTAEPSQLYHNSLLVAQYATPVSVTNTPDVYYPMLWEVEPTSESMSLSEPQAIAGNVRSLAIGLKVKFIFGETGIVSTSSRKTGICVPCMRYDIEQRGSRRK